LAAGAAGLDPDLPGFGPFGTSGRHCFDPGHPAYVRIAALTALRRSYPVLRHGRQYARPILPSADVGPLLAWSRILDDEEALCVVNPDGAAAHGGEVLVDAGLSGSVGTMQVVLHTGPAAGASAGPHPVGARLPVQIAADGAAFVAVRGLAPSEVLVLTNRPPSDP
jgi:hypothetical protein